MKPYLILTLIITCSIGTFIFLVQKKYHERIYPQRHIEGVDVSGKSMNEAFTAVNSRYPEEKKIMIVFTYDGNPVATVSAQQLQYRLPVNDAVNYAYRSERSGIEGLIAIAGIKKTRILLNPRYNNAIIEKNLKELADAYKVEAINARFEFKDNKVTAFAKEQPGYRVDTAKMRAEIEDYLAALPTKQLKDGIHYVNVQRVTQEPSLRLKDSNNLGIYELIASGSSHFAGSSAERIHNVTTGAQRLSGTIIPKDSEFSFVSVLGDISRATGFKPAYIIRNGKTVLDDGGGICQVSTTVFRAALNAGVPITERHAHAYRVGYYEQDMPPGLDATIYSPTVDFRFQNDYPSALLLQTDIDYDTLTLTVYLYGTKDSRRVAVGTPVVSQQSPPPPAEYIDEPSLPSGTLKQVDFSAPGGYSVFSYVVEKNGKRTIDTQFSSSYRPWKAIFLRGTL